jgi:hypothetical protein
MLITVPVHILEVVNGNDLAINFLFPDNGQNVTDPPHSFTDDLTAAFLSVI